MNPVKPRVFVGSSTEAAVIDRQVRTTLESLGAMVVGWREVFRPGDYPLEALLNLGASVDAALLIATPDDLTDFRGSERPSPRDNVLLELGMFLSHFGKRRAGILHVRSENKIASLPSDLHGITTLVFDTSRPHRNEAQLSLWLEAVREEMEGEHPELAQVLDTLYSTLRSVPAAWQNEIERYVLSSFVSALKSAAQGQIILSPGQYYQALYEEIDAAAAPSEVVAVATLSSALWTENCDQQRYIDKNVEAVRRGANIRRLFVVPERDWSGLQPAVRQLLQAGVGLRRARPTVLAEAAHLEDMVIFSDGPNGGARTFVADHAFNDASRIRRGRLILDSDRCAIISEAFERVWASASVVTLRELTSLSRSGGATPEPGLSLKEYTLAQPVVTCDEAAAAKGISLENELKSLVLLTQKGLVVLHLPGDGRVALRSVKNALEVSEACLAAPEALETLGLSPGTVCAVKDPTWSLPHLVSRRVLQLDMVSTNNGTHRGFYRFHPQILLEAASVMIGDFEAITD